MQLMSRELQIQSLVFGELLPKVELEITSKPYSEHCQIDAQNDLEAVQCWLQRYKSNQHTFNAYYKEARRLLLWCSYEKGLKLGQLKVQDLEDYFGFLKAPPAHWCTIPFELKTGKQKSWRPLKEA